MRSIVIKPPSPSYKHPHMRSKILQNWIASVLSFFWTQFDVRSVNYWNQFWLDVGFSFRKYMNLSSLSHTCASPNILLHQIYWLPKKPKSIKPLLLMKSLNSKMSLAYTALQDFWSYLRMMVSQLMCNSRTKYLGLDPPISCFIISYGSLSLRNYL